MSSLSRVICIRSLSVIVKPKVFNGVYSAFRKRVDIHITDLLVWIGVRIQEESDSYLARALLDANEHDPADGLHYSSCRDAFCKI